MKTIYGIKKTVFVNGHHHYEEQVYNAMFGTYNGARKALCEVVNSETDRLNNIGNRDFCPERAIIFGGISLSYWNIREEYKIELFPLIDDGEQVEV